MYIKELTSEEFETFSNQFEPSSIYQSEEYARVMEKQQFNSMLLGFIDDYANIVAASLVLVEKKHGFSYAYAPRGFLINYSNFELVKNFTNHLKKYLGKKGIIAIKLCPMIIKNTTDKDGNIVQMNGNYDLIFNNLRQLGYYHYGYNNFFEALRPRFEAVLDLTLPYYLLFKNFKKETRTKIRSSAKNGVHIYRGNKNDLKYLYLQTKDKYPRDLKYFEDCFEVMNKDNKIDFYYTKLNTEEFLINTKKEYERIENENSRLNDEFINNTNDSKLLNKKLASDNLLTVYEKKLVKATNLLRDYPGGLITSSVLIAKHNKCVYLLIDGYDKKVKYTNSKHLLIWSLVEKYSKEGYQKFYFGGISNPALKNTHYDGLNTFKLNFNALAVEYMGDLELVTNSALYFMYKNAAPIASILKK